MTSDTDLQRIGEGTKRFPQMAKRFPQMAKRFPQMAKGMEAFTQWVDETMTAYSEAGAYGNYVVKISDGMGATKDVPVQGAIAIRVLPGGQLNLVTDAGRWFVFAPGTWTSVSPEQPQPGECKFCGHRPYAANGAQ